MKTQRYTATPIASGGAGINVILAKSDYSRVYLGFFNPSGGSGSFPVHIRRMTTADPGMLLSSTGTGAALELFRWRHGDIVTSEWYAQSGSILGTVFAYALELFEIERPEPRSDGGVIIGGRNVSDAMQSSQAFELRRLVEAAGKWGRNGQ